MHNHWTYEAFKPKDDLAQGDILLPNDELRQLFDSVYPRFLRNKYVGFIVLTQSCDLAQRRRRGCSAQYISLAVIVELSGVLTNLLNRVCRPLIEGVYLDEWRSEARKLLGRVFNQNEQGLGLFYLHPNADVGIVVESVALLRVSVAFSAEHYDVMRNARQGRLALEFKNKLGWLVGNIYSRVGTRDWSSEPDGQRVMDEMTTRFLDDDDCAIWVSADAHEAAKDAGIKIGDLPREEILGTLEQYAPLAPRDEALVCVKEVVTSVLGEHLTDSETDDRAEILKNILHRLRNNQSFGLAFKRARKAVTF